MGTRALSVFVTIAWLAAALRAAAIGHPLLYALEPYENSVAVIHTFSNAVVTHIPVGSEPVGLAVAPDGRSVYVANRQSSSVSVIRTATNTVIDTITIPEAGCSALGCSYPGAGDGPFLPGPAAVSVDGNRLYVALDYPDGCPYESSLAIIDTTTGALQISGVVAGEASIADLAADPGGALYAAVSGGCSDYFYYTGFLAGTLDTGAFFGSLSFLERQMPVYSGDLALGRDVSTAYVANSDANAVTAVDLNSLRHFDAMTREITVGAQPVGVALNRTGTRLYVANRCGDDSECGEPGSVWIVDTTTDARVARIPVGTHPTHLVLTSDDRLAYVANSGDASVSVIHTALQVVATTVSLTGSPSRIAIADVPIGEHEHCMDCNGSGAVTTDEVVKLIARALGVTRPLACAAADANGDGAVRVDEILRAETYTWKGCP